MTSETARTVLVTGAGRGLGLELCRQYAVAGWQVIACARNPAGSAGLEALAAAHSNIAVERLDITDQAAVAGLAQTYRDRPLDVLINNAGILGRPPLSAKLDGQHFGSMDFGLWSSLFDTNTMGPVRMAEAFCEHVAASTERKIISLSSGTGSIAEGKAAAIGYTTSKTALNKAMTLIARALAPRGIIVAVVCPGYVKTDMNLGGATVEIAASVTGLRRIIAGLTPADAGTFTRYNGERIPW